MRITISEATEEDSEAIWHLANDSLVRANSFSNTQISWEQHKQWFAQKLHEKTTTFYIVKNSADEFVGQVRFEAKTEGIVISISIMPAFRGCGLASTIINTACDYYFNSNVSVNEILAYIKIANKASVRSFEKSNFCLVNTKNLHNKHNESILMIRLRNNESSNA